MFKYCFSSVSLHLVLQVPISLQFEASPYLPPPLPTDHCGDGVWQPTLWDRRRECPAHLKPLNCPYNLKAIMHSHLQPIADTVSSLSCFAAIRKIVNMKYRYETSRKDISELWPTTPSQLFILYSLLLHPGGGNVNTNRWCPAPSASETQRLVLFSPPLMRRLLERWWGKEEGRPRETGGKVEESVLNLGDAGRWWEMEDRGRETRRSSQNISEKWGGKGGEKGKE